MRDGEIMRESLVRLSLIAVLLLIIGTSSFVFAQDEAEVDQNSATEEEGVKVGFLKCDVGSGFGLIFGSTRDVNCIFTPTFGDYTERYVGSISNYGVDIGFKRYGVMLWGVFSPTADFQGRSLEGKYGGLTGEAAVVYGVGAKALLGGSEKSMALQPMSIEGVRGLNIAAGITSLELTKIE